MSGHGMDRAVSRYGQLEGSCDSGNENSGSIKGREFLDLMKTS